jgi:hypothetical protein
MYTTVGSDSCSRPPLRIPSHLLQTHDERLDPRRVRSEVERVLDLYLSVDFFSMSGGAVHRRMVRQAEGEAPLPHQGNVVQAEKEIALWKATIGRKLNRLARHHEKALVSAAQTKRQIRDYENQVMQLDAILRSPSRSQGIRKHRDHVQFVRDFLHASLGEIRAQRNSAVRGGLYREAVLVFWMVITQTPEVQAYCLREDAAS